MIWKGKHCHIFYICFKIYIIFYVPSLLFPYIAVARTVPSWGCTSAHFSFYRTQYCIGLYPSSDTIQPVLLPAGAAEEQGMSAAMDWLPTTVSWYSFFPPAWIFCCRPYFTGINLYSAQTVENNCARERKGYDYPRKVGKGKHKDNLPGHPKNCISATLCGQTQD